MSGPTWLTAYLDLPRDRHDRGTAFWTAATRTRLSTPRGADGEFASLVPEVGEDHVRVQRLGAGDPRVHLDLYEPDLEVLAARLVDLGATETGRIEGAVVLASPGGFPLCAVSGERRPPSPPLDWGGHRSRLDQVCLDIPSAAVADERRFWADALESELVPSVDRAEFVDVRRPEHLPLRLLLQEVGHDGPVTAHLDWATDDRDAEVDRLVAHGARVEGPGDGWTVLVDPTGLRFCVTDRRPLEF